MSINSKQEVILLGWGRSGSAVAQRLLKQSRPPSIFVIDQDKTLKLPRKLVLIPESLEKEWKEIISRTRTLIVAPGFPPSNPVYRYARSIGSVIIGELEWSLRQFSNPMIGITGSNGKTSVTLMVTHVLNTLGQAAVAVGNVGTAAASINPKPNEWLIVEMSSFQLETMSTPLLDLGIVLNITPNHLDRHLTMEDYVGAKSKIQDCMKEKGTLWVEETVLKKYPSFWTHSSVHPLKEALGEPSDSLSPNEQAVYLITKKLGFNLVDVKEALKSYQRPKYRLESLGEFNGVEFINDSKATSVAATLYALKSLSKPITLIAGGVHKGGSYLPLKEEISTKVKKLILIGEARDIIASELKGCCEIVKRESLEDALKESLENAKSKECVLLSPGCSSFDMFSNYEKRGEAFESLVSQTINRG